MNDVSTMTKRSKRDEDRAGWSTKQWYEHVGAWETKEGFITFGSIMAVRAMLVLSARTLQQQRNYVGNEQLPRPELPRYDDIAVDYFAAAMKTKLDLSRANGRSGWDDPTKCSIATLQSMLIEHLAKGDPIDAANFCMMLWIRNGQAATKQGDE